MVTQPSNQRAFKQRFLGRKTEPAATNNSIVLADGNIIIRRKGAAESPLTGTMIPMTAEKRSRFQRLGKLFGRRAQ